MNIKTSLRNWLGSLAFAVALMPALPAFAQDASLATELSDLQHGWDRASYQTPDSADKERQLEALAARSEQLTRKYPGRAEPLVWEGIVLSSYARAKGGLGALSLAKKSRDLLLEAAKIDPAALQGSAYTSLGALYYKVPGWPIAFGDKDKARDLLQKALAINPKGIDANYFFADYLVETGEPQKAVAHLEKVMQAAPRAGRQIADEGRRAEARELMEKIKSK